MKWINLKQNKCPQCNKVFGVMSFSIPGTIACFNCHFKIGEKRFNEIVNSQVTQGLPSMNDDGDQTTPENYLTYDQTN